MKKVRYSVLTAVLVLAALMLCSSMSLGAPAKTISLLTDKANWEASWLQMGRAASTKVSVDLDMTGYTGLEMYMAAVRTSVSSPNAPELFTWWSNWKLKELVDVGLVKDITDVYKAYRGQIPEGVLKAVSFDGKIYGVPIMVSYSVVWYNKHVFNKYGLVEPKTWDEFIKICDTLRQNGVTPMGSTVAGVWPSFTWFQALISGIDPNAYEAVTAGKMSWTSKPVQQTFELWRSLIKKGYFSDPGTDLGAELPSMFAQGQIGMFLFGDFYSAYFDSIGLKAGVDYDAFLLPSSDPALNPTTHFEIAPMLVSAKSRDLDSAIKFVSYWLSPEGQELWAKLQGFVPVNSTAKLDNCNPVKAKIARQVGKGKVEVAVRFWEATPPELSLSACELFGKFVLNPDSYQAVMGDLDKMARSYWGKR